MIWDLETVPQILENLGRHLQKEIIDGLHLRKYEWTNVPAFRVYQTSNIRGPTIRVIFVPVTLHYPVIFDLLLTVNFSLTIDFSLVYLFLIFLSYIIPVLVRRTG